MAASKRCGIPDRQCRYIWKKACDQGYDARRDPVVLDHHVIDKPRSGRPKEITKELGERLISLVRADRAGREKSSESLVYLVKISASSALRILHQHRMSRVKPTRKSGLSIAQKAARLAFCKAHESWTLEDWKNVIWSDETSVVVG